MPRLLEPGPDAAVREIPLTGEEFLIGRGNDCDLRLHISEISRHHCLIRLRGNEISVSDLGSANGTYVNGTRVISQTIVRTGDEIRLGPCRFFIDLGDDPHWEQQFFKKDTDPHAQTARLKPQDMFKTDKER